MTGIAGLLGALGLVAVVFALLNLVLALFGAPMDVVWMGANLTVGSGLLVWAAVLNFDLLRERFDQRCPGFSEDDRLVRQAIADFARVCGPVSVSSSAAVSAET